MKTERYFFVINPISGGQDKQSCADYIQQHFDEQKLLLQVYNTTGADDYQVAQEMIEHFDPQVVVAMGGDGTINLVARLLQGSTRLFGIIPMGSANGMAAELNISSDMDLALKILTAGHARSVDALTINRHLCLHLSDVGVNAKVIKRFEEQKMRGMWGYARQYVREIFRMKSDKFGFTIDGRRFIKKAHMVAIANATRYGTGAIINPDGQIDDGRFEICIIKPFPWYGIFSITLSMFLGRIKSSPHVEIHSGQSARIENYDREVLQVDGEVIDSPPHIDVSVVPAAYRILVPS